MKPEVEESANRLWYWIAQYGHTKQPEFIADLKAVLEHAFPEQPQPAEDPDEWVVLDPVKYADHVPRVGIDQFEGAGKDVWITQENNHTAQKVGAFFESCGAYHRCRRRDLPKVEQKKTTDDFGMYLESIIAKDPQLKAEVDAAEAELAAIDARLNKSNPQPQKTRVRLWIEGPTKMVMCRDKAPYGDWQELHHDSEGFYVEGGQP